MAATSYLALLKILLSFLTLISLVSTQYKLFSSLLVVSAIGMDFLYFYMSQRSDNRSNFNTYLKFTADDIFLILVLIALSKIDRLHVWVTIPFTCVCFMISGLRCYAASEKVMISLVVNGKLAFIFTYLGIFGLILDFRRFYWLLIIAIILRIFATIRYMNTSEVRDILIYGLTHKR